MFALGLVREFMIAAISKWQQKIQIKTFSLILICKSDIHGEATEIHNQHRRSARC